MFLLELPAAASVKSFHPNILRLPAVYLFSIWRVQACKTSKVSCFYELVEDNWN